MKAIFVRQFEHDANALTRFVRSLISNEEEAEEIVSEVFESRWRRHEFRGNSASIHRTCSPWPAIKWWITLVMAGAKALPETLSLIQSHLQFFSHRNGHRLTHRSHGRKIQQLPWYRHDYP